MNRQRYYNYIAEKIGTLASIIKTNGKLNFLDLNIHSETFFRDFLNILYDYELIPSNVGKANYEAIDLIDEQKKIVVQVSSTATPKKINDTLEKKKIKDLAQDDYKLKFLFIADEAKKLREKTYINKHNINFEPGTDIMDKVTILESVSQLPIDKLTNLYDLVQKEFGERPNIVRISSNLATIVNFLAKENLENVTNHVPLNEYGIEEKIEFNNLMDIKESTFDAYIIYYGMLDKLYEEFIRGGTNKTLSVFRKIASFYEKEIVNKDISNIDKFFNILGKVQEHVMEGDMLSEIPEEEIDMCVRIIVVDAFVRCKIFKNPRGYTHVATK
ncbi:ABC-three component system protein [Bacillus sp. FSL R9-9492]|uniref:ABC-three component system protein n=1 Tax=Bacillus sp. FSL R9-9492 TaxID=2921592 RepID=UPI0030FA1B60